MTSAFTVERLLGLNNNPDPVKAAVSRIRIPTDIDPADIVQHCRLRVVLAAPRYTPALGREFSYAFGIAIKEAITFLRNHDRKAKRLEPLPRQLNSRPDPRTVPDKRDAVIDRVRNAVRKLPKDLRQAVRLVDLEEKSKAEACKGLGVSMRELNERLRDGKSLLKRILSGKPLKRLTASGR